VPVPEGERVWEVVLNRRGDRMAWTTQRLDPEAWPNCPVRLFTTNTEGGDRTDIGDLSPLAGQDEATGRPQISWLRHLLWTPDDTRISFTYCGDLWTVPVAE
jgi:hypothetical protein